MRAGPYAPAVLRFEISFPATYPDLPPRIALSSDTFHPLCVPSTVYTFSTGALDAAGTVSASDDERLPPGSFSLRYAFPNWFGRQGSLQSSLESNSKLGSSENGAKALERITANGLQGVIYSRSTTLKVLEHFKEAFENEALLDALPLEAAGNPSAWHAWRAHRGLAHRQARGRSPEDNGTEKPQTSPRHPGEWNWDGVWESRVREGIEISSNEATLFTSTGRIRFSKLEDDQLADIMKEMFSAV